MMSLGFDRSLPKDASVCAKTPAPLVHSADTFRSYCKAVISANGWSWNILQLHTHVHLYCGSLDYIQGNS